MKRPIGIFDSGVGGLTVFREIRTHFPAEDIIYFGDTARVPYGPKSPQTVIEYSIQNARFLLQQGAKIIVVACNTSSSVALETLKNILEIPVIGVIEPGALAAVESTVNDKIGVIGTEGTIRSDAYKKAIRDIDAKCEIISKACPLLVPLAEEGWIDHSVTSAVIEEYLKPILKENIDTLVLGCTHYPILKNAITKVVGSDVKLVDSAIATCGSLLELIPEKQETNSGKDKFFVSDNEEKFRTIARNILQKEITPLQTVKLGESWYI